MHSSGQPTWLELCLSMLCLRVSTCLRFCAKSSSITLTSLRRLPCTQSAQAMSVVQRVSHVLLQLYTHTDKLYIACALWSVHVCNKHVFSEKLRYSLSLNGSDLFLLSIAQLCLLLQRLLGLTQLKQVLLQLQHSCQALLLAKFPCGRAHLFTDLD